MCINLNLNFTDFMRYLFACKVQLMPLNAIFMFYSVICTPHPQAALLLWIWNYVWICIAEFPLYASRSFEKSTLSTLVHYGFNEELLTVFLCFTKLAWELWYCGKSWWSEQVFLIYLYLSLIMHSLCLRQCKPQRVLITDLTTTMAASPNRLRLRNVPYFRESTASTHIFPTFSQPILNSSKFVFCFTWHVWRMRI